MKSGCERQKACQCLAQSRQRRRLTEYLMKSIDRLNNRAGLRRAILFAILSAPSLPGMFLWGGTQEISTETRGQRGATCSGLHRLQHDSCALSVPYSSVCLLYAYLVHFIHPTHHSLLPRGIGMMAAHPSPRVTCSLRIHMLLPMYI